ncbi:cytoskeleton protein RodZ [Colwellia chukchiensis]|uniref:Cytoskeleton protein RodZ n=1 Tax=Colwellia chukchiensis TaxID=641665 RepID=A0A1H7JGL2_9GAMM|nr:RodZ domain-containing protein [Colwellia chukchiensis]SEK73582.1 cytoskeleton protein RodZ [Colwellia chukchiensis]
MKQEQNTLNHQEQQAELPNPGTMLSQAREAHGLSQQQVAEKLNLSTSFVQNIEANKFNFGLPETFNRGYLKNYAKLVNICHQSVLHSYEQLDMSQKQSSKMQSFSKGTEKQAEHNMLMWVTYLILAIFIAATVVWWLQTPSVQPEPIASNAQLSETVAPVNEVLAAKQSGASEASLPLLTKPQPVVTDESENALKPANDEQLTLVSTTDDQPSTVLPEPIAQTQQTKVHDTQDDLVFTFAGDCWVNIYDATGERIAWGVKKSGYIMRISGQPPFSITLGKPELVKIAYNDVTVDTSMFSAGNIAKFSLPLTP